MSKRWPDKTVIGLTGNIGTGKSVVRRILEHLGAFGLDADGLAHRAMSPGAPAYLPIVESFGKWIIDPDGRINRERLGNVVFSDPNALAQLEKISHPIIRQGLDLLIKRANQDVVVIEAIKLFEGGLADECDAVWVVDAPEDVQLERLMNYRKMSEAAARLRIETQPSQADKLERADVVIKNDGGYEQTFEQVQKHFNTLMGIEEVEEEEVELEEKAAPPKEEEEEVKAEAEVEETEAAAPPPGEKVLSVKRGSPKHASQIAELINQQTNTSLARSDIMYRFGQKAYMLVYSGDQLVGLGGCQVENLIARTDELLLADAAPIRETVASLVEMIEDAANALQAEISMIFLPENTEDELRQAVLAQGYEKQTVEDLRISHWREAAEDSAPPNTYMVIKRLREDRVLRPI